MYLKKLWRPNKVKTKYIVLVKIRANHESMNWPWLSATSNERRAIGVGVKVVGASVRVGFKAVSII